MSAAGAFDLIRTFEEEKARALGISARREAGMYYTPPDVAACVVELALRFHRGARGSVLDPCAGAGAFLVAAARAGLSGLRGIDRDPEALRIARRALRLCGARVTLTHADSLTFSPRPAGLVISNPPYGHVATARERAELVRSFPALRGGEIDRPAHPGRILHQDRDSRRRPRSGSLHSRARRGGVFAGHSRRQMAG